jgi:hypothetical protein
MTTETHIGTASPPPAESPASAMQPGGVPFCSNPRYACTASSIAVGNGAPVPADSPRKSTGIRPHAQGPRRRAASRAKSRARRNLRESTGRRASCDILRSSAIVPECPQATRRVTGVRRKRLRGACDLDRTLAGKGDFGSERLGAQGGVQCIDLLAAHRKWPAVVLTACPICPRASRHVFRSALCRSKC